MHPLNRKVIENYLVAIPAEFVVGLRAVELLPRGSVATGEPFAEYLPDERRVRIYSVPPKRWRIGTRPQAGNAIDAVLGKLEALGACIERDGEEALILE